MKTEPTKSFPLNVVLTVTTGRLLTTPKDGGNGIEDLYEILGWLCDEPPYTHTLGRFAQEAKPHLFRWFPELERVNEAKWMSRLDELAQNAKARGQGFGEAMKPWLAWIQEPGELGCKSTYDLPQIPKNSHAVKDPIAELVELRESKDGIIIIQP